MMPAQWRPEHKLYAHQLGFTCPPFDYGAATTDFLRIAPGSVGVHGLDQRKANLGMMAQTRKYRDLADTPPRVKQVYERMKPHYDHLAAHRITH